MGLIGTLGRYAWRRNQTDGDPNTPLNEPAKTDIVPFVDAVDAEVARIEDLALSGARSPVTVRVIAASNVAIASGLENGDTVDGVVMATGDVVLLTAQTTPTQNGAYVVVASGAASRDPRYDSGNELVGAQFAATAGTNTGWIYAVRDQPVIGTDPISITRAFPLNTIGDKTVTNSKLADVASGTFKGRLTNGTGSLEDLTATQVKTALAVNNVDNTADASKPVSGPQQTALGVSYGEMFDETIVSVQVFNGATTVVSAGKNVGYSIPSGSTGATSLLIPYIDLSADEALALLGRTIVVEAVYEVTPNFRTEKPFSSNVMNNRVNGSFSYAGTREIYEQTGNLLRLSASYVVPAGLDRLGLIAQVSGSAVANNAHSITLKSITIKIKPSADKATSGNDAGLEARDRRALTKGLVASAADVRKKALPIFPNAYDEALVSVQIFNGATRRLGAGGRALGWTIPAGSAGNSTLVQAILFGNFAKHFAKGATYRVKMGFDTSDNYARGITVRAQVSRNGASVNTTIMSQSNVQVSPNRRVIEFTSTLDGTETRMAPYVQTTSGTLAAADEWILLTDLEVTLDAVGSDVLSAQDVSSHFLAEKLAGSAPAPATGAGSYVAPVPPAYQATVVVKQDGTGQFTTIKAALASITDAGPDKRYQVLIHPGTYDEMMIVTKDWVDLVGTERRSCIIQGFYPDDIDPEILEYDSPIDFDTTGRLENLTILGKNCRYAIHSDSGRLSASAGAGPVQVVSNCHIEHLGNEGAKAYQVGLGNPSTIIRGGVNAWGAGTINGAIVIGYNTTFKSMYSGGFANHTRENAKSATYIELNGCRMVTGLDTENGRSVTLSEYGSQYNDQVVFNDCEFDGDFVYGGSWMRRGLDYQPADKSLTSVFINGGSPVVFRNVMSDAGALRIDSANTGDGSSVDVSGSAVPILFGSVTRKDGKGGFKGYNYGYHNVVIGLGLMGKRLGNCTSAPKTLAVSFQGAAPLVVTFDQDHTAQSNATILAMINAVLGAAGTASLFNIAARYRPQVPAEEKTLKNTSAVGLPMGAVLAYDGDHRWVRLMTSADPASAFCGVAWEDIYPGETGRIKVGGFLPIADVLRTDSAAFTFGDTFSVSSGAPGKVSKGGAQGFLRAIRTDAVRLG